jgi:lincosamide nucleotidyltransferase B/F
MNIDEYNAFTHELWNNLEGDPRVLGLIAVGSTAQRDTQPDEWSDHDFFVVVEPGLQEKFRVEVNWVPDLRSVMFQFRETAHGLKILYEQGYLVELAVFDPDELYLARVNQYRILLDRSDLARRMGEIASATRGWSRSCLQDDSYLLGQILTGVLVAHGRWVRGERLSARACLMNQVVPQLVRLLVKYRLADAPEVLDNIDPLRRFELGFGALGATLNQLLDQPVPEAASGLLELTEQELAGVMWRFRDDAWEVVRRRIKPPSESSYPGSPDDR